MQCLKMHGADSQDMEGTASVHDPLAFKLEFPREICMIGKSELKYTEQLGHFNEPVHNYGQISSKLCNGLNFILLTKFTMIYGLIFSCLIEVLRKCSSLAFLMM